MADETEQLIGSASELLIGEPGNRDPAVLAGVRPERDQDPAVGIQRHDRPDAAHGRATSLEDDVVRSEALPVPCPAPPFQDLLPTLGIELPHVIEVLRDGPELVVGSLLPGLFLWTRGRTCAASAPPGSG